MIIVDDSISIYAFQEEYESWCNKHGFSALHPDNVERVFIAYESDPSSPVYNIPLYSCFFWTTLSRSCVIGFPLSNPFVDYKHREGVLDIMFKNISEHAEVLGYKLIWTTSNTERVENSLIANDFIKADENVHQYIKITNN